MHQTFEKVLGYLAKARQRVLPSLGILSFILAPLLMSATKFMDKNFVGGEVLTCTRYLAEIDFAQLHVAKSHAELERLEIIAIEHTLRIYRMACGLCRAKTKPVSLLAFFTCIDSPQWHVGGGGRDRASISFLSVQTDEWLISFIE